MKKVMVAPSILSAEMKLFIARPVTSDRSPLSAVFTALYVKEGTGPRGLALNESSKIGLPYLARYPLWAKYISLNNLI